MKINTFSTALNRRNFAMGVGATGVALGAGIVPAPAWAFVSAAASFIGETLGKFASEVSSQALVRSLAPTYSATHREMQGAGHQPQLVRGWQSNRPDCLSPLITIVSGDDCLGIVTETRAGCSGCCVSLPPETAAWASCAHPRMGLPGYAARRGQAFTTEHVVRYLSPVRVERRRRGSCGGTVSIFVTQACIVVEIEPYGNFARVSIGNPVTGRRYKNDRLPLMASDEAKAGAWDVV